MGPMRYARKDQAFGPVLCSFTLCAEPGERITDEDIVVSMMDEAMMGVGRGVLNSIDSAPWKDLMFSGFVDCPNEYMIAGVLMGVRADGSMETVVLRVTREAMMIDPDRVLNRVEAQLIAAKFSLDEKFWNLRSIVQQTRAQHGVRA